MEFTTVTASITETIHDPMAKARFANSNRAGTYAQSLIDSGDYAFVQITGADGTMHCLTPVKVA